ncbi:MAG: NAD(+) synthase [Actinobacteria bacterium]|nr:NAD(+) synthase [Actinomycetota bacterium]
MSEARLTPAVFDLDVQATAETIERFISDQLTDLGRTGIVVPLSGGLDSSTVLALCARAVGPDRVTALLLPDKRGSRDALRYSRLVADRLGVRVVVQKATRLNRAAGVYRFIGYRLPLPRLVAREVRRHLSDEANNVFLAGVRGTDHLLTRQALAAIYARQRLRMVMTYRYAELHRLLVVGTAHKSEDLLGLFVKFGVDDSADLMPLKGLYRSHVVQVAAAVGVPPEILARTPNPEMLPGIDDKYLDVFGVPAPTIDLALWGIEHALTDTEIARDISLPEAKVAELRDAVRLSGHMREPSRHPDLAV